MKTALTPKKIVILIVSLTLLFLLGAYAFYRAANAPWDNIEEARNRKERDFVYKDFTVGEVWSRTIGENRSGGIKYVFIRPRGVSVNLSFGADKIFTSRDEEAFNAFRNQFKEGDSIKVKLYAPDYEKAEKRSFFTGIKSFFSNDNNEAEIYELRLNGEKIYEQDIHETAVNFRSGGDLSVSNIRVFLAGLFVLVLIILTIRNRFRSSDAK